MNTAIETNTATIVEPTTEPALQLEHVSYSYSKGGKRVLIDKNYAFHPGTVVSSPARPARARPRCSRCFRG